jgi:hypothetical protein
MLSISVFSVVYFSIDVACEFSLMVSNFPLRMS